MHQPEILAEIVVLFGTAVVAAWAFRLLRAPSIIGFLFTGILIGPSGVGLIRPEDVGQLAELGLILLLFTVGLELSPKPLVRIGRSLLIASTVQMAVTAAATTLVLVLFAPFQLPETIVIGVVVAFSSTAIVLKQLSDRGETGTVTGMITTGILLLQDVVVIVIMLVLPVFAATPGTQWRESLLRVLAGLVGLALIYAGGRRILALVLNRLIRRGGREMTALFAVLMACGGAWLAGLAGWSLALGACIAGLLLAEADQRHQLVADITPFRDVFNALFFVSLGMLVDLHLVVAHLGVLLLAIGVTLVLKTFVTLGAVRVAGWPMRPAIHVGLGLCTVSEFGYVLAAEADKLNLVSPALFNGVIAYAVGTMMAGAILVPVSGPLSRQVAQWTDRTKRSAKPAQPGAGGAPVHHVIVVGYGVNGKNVVRVLGATQIPHCLIEMNPGLVHEAREADVDVMVGDAARLPILEHAGLVTAHALVVAINDFEATLRIVSQARAARPDLFILARTRFVGDIDALYQVGASQVIPEDFETSIEISAHILKEMNIPDNIVEAQLAAIRAGRYAMLRGATTERTAQDELMQVLQMTATRTYYLKEDSPACDKTIAEINLRAATGVTIIAVVRNGTPTTNPPASFRLARGDVLVLLGGHVQLEAARALL